MFSDINQVGDLKEDKVNKPYLVHKGHLKVLENQNKNKQIVHGKTLLQQVPENNSCQQMKIHIQ